MEMFFWNLAWALIFGALTVVIAVPAMGLMVKYTGWILWSMFGEKKKCDRCG